MTQAPPSAPSPCPTPRRTKPNKLGRAGFVLGILGLLLPLSGVIMTSVGLRRDSTSLAVTLFVPATLVFVGGLCMIVGIILSAVGMKRKGIATAGLVISLVALVLSVPLAVRVLLPGLNHAHELARRTVSAMSLKSIGCGLIHYYDNNDNIYPQDLQPLVEEGFVSEKGLFYPGWAGDPKASYFYLPPTAGAGGKTIVACEQIGCGGIGRNYLTLDGAVLWLSEAEFQAELSKPHNARFAAALHEAEGAAAR